MGGEIKRRISDFVVEEISSDGAVHEVRAFKGEGKAEIPFELPEKTGRYLIAELEKFDMDLNYAIRRVARWMHSSRYAVGYAGMKDKRAVTCQLVSLKEDNVERLKEFGSRYISIRPLYWQDSGIGIGMLKGNRFTVTVRGIALAEKEIRERAGCCLAEMENGIANYFGGQRFGGIRGITHKVGRAFIDDDFEKGVMEYLCNYSEAEEEEIKEARKNLSETQDFVRASKEFPVKYRYERSMLHHLCKYPKDFVNAFHKLPKGLRFMFTHAYQSYLFNRIISRRYELGLGIKKINDDLVDEEGRPTAVLMGYETEFPDSKEGEIERGIAEEENIKPENFRIKKMPELSSKGSRRAIVVFPENAKLLSVADDEFSEGMKKAVLSFSLPKGSYATVALGEIIKNGLCLQ
jgi:tRNA pseudouridine13 synthase